MLVHKIHGNRITPNMKTFFTTFWKFVLLFYYCIKEKQTLPLKQMYNQWTTVEITCLKETEKGFGTGENFLGLKPMGLKPAGNATWIAAISCINTRQDQTKTQMAPLHSIGESAPCWTDTQPALTRKNFCLSSFSWKADPNTAVCPSYLVPSCQRGEHEEVTPKVCLKGTECTCEWYGWCCDLTYAWNRAFCQSVLLLREALQRVEIQPLLKRRKLPTTSLQ